MATPHRSPEGNGRGDWPLRPRRARRGDSQEGRLDRGTAIAGFVLAWVIALTALAFAVLGVTVACRHWL